MLLVAVAIAVALALTLGNQSSSSVTGVGGKAGGAQPTSASAPDCHWHGVPSYC